MKEMKYLGSFRGQDMYGNSFTEECLEWHRIKLNLEQEKNTALEAENFRLSHPRVSFFRRFIKELNPHQLLLNVLK